MRDLQQVLRAGPREIDLFWFMLIALVAVVAAVAMAVLGEGGPLAVNGASAAPKLSALHPLAQSALGTGYSVGFVVCGSAALFSALLALLALRGRVAARRSDTAH